MRSYVCAALALAMVGCSGGESAKTIPEQPPSASAQALVETITGILRPETASVASTERVGAERSRALEVHVDDAAPSFRLRDAASGVEAEVAADATGWTASGRAGSWLAYQSQSSPSPDLAIHPAASGVEDFRYFAKRPARERVRYRLRLGSGVAGLRVVNGTIELMDASSAPRIRMTAPVIVSRPGARRAVDVNVLGCAVDRDPRLPWRRAVVPPGSRDCVIELAWSGVDYPAVLDPSWQPTAAMSFAREAFTLTRIAGGMVLAAGGTYSNCGLCSGPCGEVYDPAHESWANTQCMSAFRYNATATLLDNGQVLVAGGTSQYLLYGSAQDSAELYDPVQNKFTPTAAMNVARAKHGAARFGSQALVVGGLNGNGPIGTSELFDGTTWTQINSSAGHVAPAIATLQNGDVLVAGGATTTTAAELYTATGWQSAGDTKAPRGDATATLVGKRVYLVGGSNPAATTTFEVYDPDKTPPWQPLVTLKHPRFGHTTTLLQSGSLLVAGGKDVSSFSTYELESEIIDTNTDATSASATMTVGRAFYAAALLDDGDVLAAGGEVGAASAELFSQSPLGAACTAVDDCKSGHCVDGVCCDSACNGMCQACVAAKTNGTDGTCAPIPAGSDPDDECADDGQPTCQHDGSCDGAGACELYAAGAVCGLTTCVGNVQTGYACNGNGFCVAGSQFDCAAEHLTECRNSACLATCADAGDCIASAYCAGGTCTPKKALGSSCTSDAECDSAICVDKICCNAPCAGKCEACNGSGECLPTFGQADACPLDDPNDVCSQRTCDGIARNACDGFVSDQQTCRTASCSNGVATQAAVCNGFGKCPQAAEVPCAPYACGTDACKTSCSTDSDCAPGAHCNTTTKQCVVSSICDGDVKVGADGSRKSCTPFACVGGECNTSCSSHLDCAASSVCNGAHDCVPAPSPAADSAGCGCQTRRTSPGGLLAALMLAALAALRRRSGFTRGARSGSIGRAAAGLRR